MLPALALFSAATIVRPFASHPGAKNQQVKEKHGQRVVAFGIHNERAIALERAQREMLSRDFVKFRHSYAPRFSNLSLHFSKWASSNSKTFAAAAGWNRA